MIWFAIAFNAFLIVTWSIDLRTHTYERERLTTRSYVRETSRLEAYAEDYGIPLAELPKTMAVGMISLGEALARLGYAVAPSFMLPPLLARRP